MFHGFLVIDKPVGISSHDAVDQSHRWFPRRTKIGHTGTLDPLANGVLVLAIGCATRLSNYVQDAGKSYIADLTLGATSTTDDSGGKIQIQEGSDIPTLPQIQAELADFIGLVDQVPPAFSAVHVDGKRAYEKARQGKTVILQAKPVRIDSIAILDYEYPTLKLKIDCGKGTYIRSIARDLGEKLNCGAYIQSLCRTQVGKFTLNSALPVTAFREDAREKLLPIETAVDHLERLTLTDSAIAYFHEGRSIFIGPMDSIAPESELIILDPQSRFHGLGRIDERGILFPMKVFHELNFLE